MSEIERYLEHSTLILLSNREPYEHVRGPAGIEIRRPAGGVVSALDPMMQRLHGTWVAWGSGSADRESTPDEEGRVPVPPEDPSYTLRRVWLDDADVAGFYLGFSNSALWPLCHMLVQHFEFRAEYWDRYKAVNERFAIAVADEMRDVAGTPVVWVHDYHFALVPEMLRDLDEDVFIHQFWHIPFPPPDILRLLPVAVHDDLLRGLLGNDLIEFHTDRYARNFLDCVSRLVPSATVDEKGMTVTYRGRTVHVGAFPISIDVELYESLARAPESVERVRTLRSRYATGVRKLGVSVDRIDYTKGIPERLRALDLLWTQRPEIRGRFTFLCVATPSRSDLEAYSSLEEEIVQAVLEINQRHGSPEWQPIVFIHSNVDTELLASVYRAADLCLVSSLQDGMNLVAKEFVACQLDERGVLVLSRFTGAAEQIEGAVLINPFNVDGFVDGICRALDMSPDERRLRMRRMRGQLRRATIFTWLDQIMSRVHALMAPRRRTPAAAQTAVPARADS